MQSHYRSPKKNINATCWQNYAWVVIGLLFILSLTRMQYLFAEFAQAQPLKVEQIYPTTLANKRLARFANAPCKNLSATAFKKYNENITQNPKPCMAHRCNVHMPNLTAI
jgi:hypothetical protein